ncbi:hypothetical protein DL764_008351 [Monosporascus ibericus]|uniref:DUF7707 domain-containing protein n=1 Tax=Monosporascus ibericus TaxID=155417 RepID=A0A4Q4SXS3_9PEZI|nr:hypothetical protein DL764_008351 [Monosporascus ibericus]
MFRASIAFAALTALSLVSAQAQSNSTFTLPNPSEVDPGLRANWCRSQRTACDNLCQQVTANDCDIETLDFSCVCSNGESPDFNEYRDTIPFFVCNQLFEDCIEDNPDDARAQANCTTTYDDNCGTEDSADAAQIDAQTSTSSPTSSATAPPETSSTGSAEATTTSDSGAMPTNMPIQHIGNGVAAVAVGVFAYML